MPRKSPARLLAHGASPALPVGVVVNAGRADKASYTGTLASLAAGAGDFVDGPAIILVGDAIAAGDWANAASFAAQALKAA